MEQLELEHLQRLANRRLEEEHARRDASEDMYEDLSEGDHKSGESDLEHSDSIKKTFQRNCSVLEIWSDSNKGKKLYIVLIRYLFSPFSLSPRTVCRYLHRRAFFWEDGKWITPLNI